MNTQKKVNGWINRDTWLVALHINNDQGNYNNMKYCGKHILSLKGFEFKEYLRDNFYYSDTINWNNVRISSIRPFIKQFIKDHKGDQ